MTLACCVLSRYSFIADLRVFLIAAMNHVFVKSFGSALRSLNFLISYSDTYHLFIIFFVSSMKFLRYLHASLSLSHISLHFVGTNSHVFASYLILYWSNILLNSQSEKNHAKYIFCVSDNSSYRLHIFS